MITHVLRDTRTGKTIWQGNGPYKVDGKPGTLGEGIVLLRIVNTPQPPANPWDLVEATETVNLAAGTLTRGFKVTARPRPVPPHVTPRQLRLWFIKSGISLATVDGKIRNETELVEWNFSSHLARGNPLVIHFASALGLTPAQMDDAFREAVSL